MKRLLRLWQPRHPAFWLMLVTNALGTVLAWVARTYELAALPAVLVVGFALGNVALGLWCMARLLRDA